MKTSSEAKVSPQYTKEEIRQHRILVGKIAGVVGAVTLGVALLTAPHHDAAPKVKMTADEQTLCEPGSETQIVEFNTNGVGNGIDGAVFKIDGSGKGEGDPCWTEAKSAVEDALDGNQPMWHQKIEIPKEVHPVGQTVARQ